MQSLVSTKAPELNARMARMAVGAMFFINGAAVATWASRIPAIQDKLQLGTGPLGIALLSMGIGALIAMSVAGALSSSIGSRPVIVWTMYISCLVLIFPPFASNLVLLSLSVVLLGIFLGSLDVAMNAHAVVVEKLYGSSIMSSFHALFSIGGIFGAFVGALFAFLRLGLETHFIVSAVTLCVFGAVMQRWLLPASADATGAKVSNTVHLETLQCMFGSPLIYSISVIMCCCFLVEGAMGDWSGVYLRRVLLTDPGFAALGYASFSIAMCAGRLTGDFVVQRLGRLRVVRYGSLVAIAGLCLVLLVPLPAVALVGFAAIGIGVANIVPIGFTAAGNAPDVEASKGIATVSLMGYVGLLAGPPLIGFAAEILTLKIALWILAVLMLLMIYLSKQMIGATAVAEDSLQAAEYPDVV